MNQISESQPRSEKLFCPPLPGQRMAPVFVIEAKSKIKNAGVVTSVTRFVTPYIVKTYAETLFQLFHRLWRQAQRLLPNT